ncbi:MAG: PTS sugar transporter subunit IIA [Phycisphaerae bacterium]
MDIVNLIQAECIKVPLAAAERFEAIEELVGVLAAAGKLSDQERVLHAIIAREKTRSTGIGLGLAVPHGKSDGAGTLVAAIGKPASPIEFESVDGRPCSMIFLLASPIDKTGPHIQALGGISRLWQTESFRTAVDGVSSAAELHDAIQQHAG